jgi:hypothetical protein
MSGQAEMGEQVIAEQRRIASHRVYYGRMSFLAQLGLLPG